MATFKWNNGNQAFYRYNRLDRFDFEEGVETTTSISATYNEDLLGPYDPTRDAYSVKITFRDAELYTIEEGSDAGDERFIDGEITSFRFFDDEGTEILKISGLSLSLPAVESMASQENYYDIWTYTAGGGHSFIGSNDASGAEDDYDGDSIQTGVGNDTVDARGGDDWIGDYGGTDTYDGGAGFDTLSYQDWFYNPAGIISGINANLSTGTVVGPDGLTDTVSKIESVRGTFLDDIIKGDSKDNTLIGLQGRDILDGRGGFDTVDYRKDVDQGGLDGVQVHLANGVARDGFGQVDKLRKIEGASGTYTNDHFTGDDNNNYFRGRDGDDIFNAGRGDDYLRGDEGADLFKFKTNNYGDDIIQDFDKSEGDRIDIDKATSYGDLTITQDGTSAIVEFGTNRLELYDVNASDLTADVFGFVI
ncbi:calcium-binding protein [Algirhabdus cladophorae]|uniref:calcium-binding protein n=1 Tax=Algirhabdus cladophorae TaxID=3377108 RepID=UPI003B84B237